MELIMQPWPWWLSGILIGLTVPLLYFLAGRGLRHFHQPARSWGIVRTTAKSNTSTSSIAKPICGQSYLRSASASCAFWPLDSYPTIPKPFLPESFANLSGGIKLLVGGFLIGFGTRYAGGCTSGHSITGIFESELAQFASHDLLLRGRAGRNLGTRQPNFLNNFYNAKAQENDHGCDN